MKSCCLELATEYSGLHACFQTIILQTDSRDLHQLPSGAGVARHAYHRTMFYKAEVWVAVRYLTGPQLAYGDRNHYWLAPTIALAMHILQTGRCNIFAIRLRCSGLLAMGCRMAF